jgi:hypothetical protein
MQTRDGVRKMKQVTNDPKVSHFVTFLAYMIVDWVMYHQTFSPGRTQRCVRYVEIKTTNKEKADALQVQY